ncbi:MAG: hypothetical protein QOF48_352 [Verrucomicrobiota bacterium]|jgi:hypothetical protein
MLNVSGRAAWWVTIRRDNTSSRAGELPYVLKPAMTLVPPAADSMAAVKTNIGNIAVSVSPPAPPALPARQPLPTPVTDPARPMLKLGLDQRTRNAVGVEPIFPAYPR